MWFSVSKYQFTVGGHFVWSDRIHNIHILDRNDPITDGIEDFIVTSEQYGMHLDPIVKVWSSTKLNGDHHTCNSEEAIWKRTDILSFLRRPTRASLSTTH
ncbi:MAG: hypothetical protein Sapg2KO_00180 [Saprospiraceae bacterium]